MTIEFVVDNQVEGPEDEIGKIGDYYRQIIFQAVAFARLVANTDYCDTTTSDSDFLASKFSLGNVDGAEGCWYFDRDEIQINDLGSTFSAAQVINVDFYSNLLIDFFPELDTPGVKLKLLRYLYELKDHYILWHEMYHRSTSSFVKDKDGLSEVVTLGKQIVAHNRTFWFQRQSCRQGVFDALAEEVSLTILKYAEEAIIDLLVLELARKKIAQDAADSGHFLNSYLDQNRIGDFSKLTTATLPLVGNQKSTFYPKINRVLEEIIAAISAKAMSWEVQSTRRFDRDLVLGILQSRQEFEYFESMARVTYGLSYLEVFTHLYLKEYPEILTGQSDDSKSGFESIIVDNGPIHANENSF